MKRKHTNTYTQFDKIILLTIVWLAGWLMIQLVVISSNRILDLGSHDLDASMHGVNVLCQLR